MTSLQLPTETAFSQPHRAAHSDYRTTYDALMHSATPREDPEAAVFLRQQLQLADLQACDLPDQPEHLEQWIAEGVSKVAEQYSVYLEQRREGAPRRFFSNKAHAMYFLQQVAPTKRVDGAWLYGLLPHWADYRFHGLIRTYLEELGDGDPALNHVSLYQKLLADMECDVSDGLDDEAWLQGAIQLALGNQAGQFLPEVIGYNLGYEQLPLHLLITSFELNELGIDPYYFTLHITIDNASTGHARKAAQSVLALMPMGEQRDDFYRRIARGYRLNELGPGSTAVIQSFDLEQELIAMLERKRTFGQHMHSDYCRLDGKTINQWLATPDQMGEFLGVLENRGWIKRHQDPTESRFWQLIDGAGAAMFGVFNAYEKQVLHDWIAGDWLATAARSTSSKRAPDAFRARFRSVPRNDGLRTADQHTRLEDLDPDVHGLLADLKDASLPRKMQVLIERMSPARHSTPAGLFATRHFVQTMAERLTGEHA
ncbi:iron-containing redox enzyme family protein [Pseudomonas sp. DWP3-1-2]|uniref:iron-containing redox enzyme family protein n=1 Tax=Pseudomonas sp. DWP3-1-2 TaxID=2804645 RepID=UPI003CF10E2D